MGAAAFASEPEFAFTDDKENRDASLVEPVDVFAAAAGSLSSSAPFPEFFSLGSFDENLLKKLKLSPGIGDQFLDTNPFCQLLKS